MPESITIHPAPHTWRSLLHHNTSPDASLLRRELNLPTDKPIIMTGHQAEFWHPGILAKYLAADAASASFNAHPAHLVVNQDRTDTVPLHYPALSNNSLSIGTATVRERKPPPTPRDPAPQVATHLSSLFATLARHSEAPTLAHQVSATTSDLMRPYLSIQPTTLLATALARTTLFQSLIAKMAHDPEVCITAYNTAAAHHPSARIRPLTASDIQDRWELPLWHLPPGKPRRHVYAEELATIPPHELAPKALFMTGLLRLAACDLFIHGTGGAGSTDSSAPDTHEGYDLITEEWLERWLGIPRASLAPITLVTATRYLPLSDSPPPTAAELARARWLAHHARHSPLLLRDPDAALAKQHLVDQIELLPRHTRARADSFQSLQSVLTAFRIRHETELASLAAAAANTAIRFSERSVIFNRTWPFALYPAATIQALAKDIRAVF